jgi:hypothetical protein
LKTIAPFCLAVMLLALPGCNDDSGVPDINIMDYRVLYSNGTATDSCSQEIKDAADTFTEFSQIYRLHFPEGEGSARLDLYWKNDGDSDELFTFFAAGTLVSGDGGPGTLEDGEINYAGGSFQETRPEGTVTFEIEGRARAAFGDLLDNAHEAYVITESSNTAAYPKGCVYTLDYTAQGLAEQGDDS